MAGSARASHCFLSSVLQAWPQGRPNQAELAPGCIPWRPTTQQQQIQTNKKQPIKCKACPRKSFCKLLELSPLCHTWICFFIPVGFDCNVSTHRSSPFYSILFSVLEGTGANLSLQPTYSGSQAASSEVWVHHCLLTLEILIPTVCRPSPPLPAFLFKKLSRDLPSSAQEQGISLGHQLASRAIIIKLQRQF